MNNAQSTDSNPPGPGDKFLHVIGSWRDPYQLLKTASLISKGAGGIDWLFRVVILGRIVMNGIPEWTRIFPPLWDSPRVPALIRMQMEIPSSFEKLQ